MANKYRIMKYNGDDPYSWAVFRYKDVRGRKGVISFGEANPIVCGMSKTDAQHTKRMMEAKNV